MKKIKGQGKKIVDIYTDDYLAADEEGLSLKHMLVIKLDNGNIIKAYLENKDSVFITHVSKENKIEPS